MMEAFNNSTAFMTDEDVAAMAHYLKNAAARGGTTMAL